MEQQLAARCAGGHAVAVNVSVFRCDALILSPGGVRVVQLPGLTSKEAESRAATFSADMAKSWWQPGPEAGRVREMLRWLWEAVCAPVLNAIGATAMPANGEPWPQVWWVPTGPLAFLPLHAAGRYPDSDPADTDTVLDRVVSSYLPSGSRHRSPTLPRPRSRCTTRSAAPATATGTSRSLGRPHPHPHPRRPLADAA